MREHFLLDPAVTYLNHGSFGACPRVVLEKQTALRQRLEREPVRFFLSDLEGMLDAVRAELAPLVGAPASDLVFVRNATAAVSAVLGSLPFGPGDELLCTDHGYNACQNALARAAEQGGARVVIARIPFPIASPDVVVEQVLAAVSSRTRLALIDHVTSPTALVFPIQRIVDELGRRGIDTLVDGAHAPGMLPLDLTALGAAYYTGNLHKWCCAPKGVGFLYVRRDRQDRIHPAVTSHGRNSPRKDRSRYLIEFDWVGSDDPTPILCVPAALGFLSGLLPGGLPALAAANHQKALRAREVLAAALGITLPCPDEMIGSMAALPLPPGRPELRRPPLYLDPLQTALSDGHRIQVPIMPWPAPPARLVRISAQIYNQPAEYERLAAALRLELGLG